MSQLTLRLLNEFTRDVMGHVVRLETKHRKLIDKARVNELRSISGICSFWPDDHDL